MREFVLAMRAIWESWNEGTKLDFRGDFYTHTLMTPMFSPGRNPHGPPKVFVAAVGELMTEAVGEVADGLLAHGFTTERYLREVTVPALERGLAKAGRDLAGYEISYPAMVVTGSTDEEVETARLAVKGQLAFYGSTPAYRPVLELHGWGDLQSELNALSKKGEWVQMAALIDDEVVDTFAAVAPPDEVAKVLRKRFGDVVTRITFYTPYRMGRERILELLGGFRT
jgi:probable F420-dependent oxidoreductase